MRRQLEPPRAGQRSLWFGNWSLAPDPRADGALALRDPKGAVMCPVCLERLSKARHLHHWSYERDLTVAVHADCHMDVLHEYGTAGELSSLASRVNGLADWRDVALASTLKLASPMTQARSAGLRSLVLRLGMPLGYEPGPAVRELVEGGDRGIDADSVLASLGKREGDSADGNGQGGVSDFM